MTDAVAEAPEEKKKPSRMGLIAGLVLAIAGGAGGFYAMRSGLLTGAAAVSDAAPGKAGPGESAPPEGGGGGIAPERAGELPSYVPLDPIVITLGRDAAGRQLKFRAELEVDPESAEEVKRMTPRFIDVLNGYLRALEISDLEGAMPLTALRAQMLRRLQVVAGRGRVRDLLIMEFVLN